MDERFDDRSDATRRQFLAGLGGTAGLAVAGCAEDSGTPTGPPGTPSSADGPDDGVATVTETGVVTTPADAPPSPTPTAAPTASPTPITPDSLDAEVTFPEEKISKWWRSTVAAASEFTV